MTITLILLAILTAPYLAANAVCRSTDFRINPHKAAILGLALLFTFTAAGHFIKTAEMTEMLPSWVPARVLLVYLTGILEFLIAAGLLIRRTRRVAGLVAIAALILFFPANIYAAIHHIPMGGHAWGPSYLFVRTPVQLVIILWAYWFAVRAYKANLKPAE